MVLVKLHAHMSVWTGEFMGRYVGGPLFVVHR